VILPRDLGDGLVLRRGRASDADQLSAFNAQVHATPDAPEPDRYIGAWVRDLCERPHPTFSPADFTIVEESASGRIVSSLNLISQTWTYGEVPFGVGRVELVGTHPDYRRRGLVREQFAVVHEWSLERGELVQGITGIPWYYRQFGYEMAMDLGGWRAVGVGQVPKLAAGTEETFGLRPAAEADLANFAEIERAANQRYLVNAQRDAAIWQLELSGRSEESTAHGALLAIERAGQVVGFVSHSPHVRGGHLVVGRLELAPGVSWVEAMPSLLRGLTGAGRTRAGAESLQGLTLALGLEHPAYHVLSDQLPRTQLPYAWYVRVADLGGFLRHIAPALEANLARSLAAGHTGELRIGFYRGGVSLRLERGRVVDVAPHGGDRRESDVLYPELTFLQQLFGRRSFVEVNAAFPDCIAKGPGYLALADALFPKRPSCVWAIA
jgi:hypothetical protein